jgi:hypothetical protein
LQSAIDEVDAMPGDGKFVFILSDANLRRYGISGKTVKTVFSFVLLKQLEKTETT